MELAKLNQNSVKALTILGHNLHMFVDFGNNIKVKLDLKDDREEIV